MRGGFPTTHDMDRPLTLLSRWQRENRIRARSVAALAFSISTLYFGTEMYQTLRGTWFESINNGHLLFAAICYWSAFALVFQINRVWRLRKLRRTRPRRLHSSEVRALVVNYGRQVGVMPVALGFGSPHERRILSDWVRTKPLVLIGPWALSLWAGGRDEFRFSLAHEMAHLTARDDRSDRIVLCHHICFAIFMGVVLVASLYDYISHAIEWNRLTSGTKVLYSRHNTTLFAFLDSLILFSLFLLVTLFLTFERVATLHGRELAADGVAAQVTGLAFPRSRQKSQKIGRWSRLLGALHWDHPERSWRRYAIQTGNPFVAANRILFVSQAFLTCYFIDICLQVLSFDAHHRASIASWTWRDRPLSIFAPFVIAALFYYNSSRLMVTAASLSASPGKQGLSSTHIKNYLAYTVIGAGLMICSSQSVWYFVRSGGIGSIWSAQWDMLSMVAISSLGMTLTLSLAAKFASGLSSGALRVLSLLPIVLVCGAAVAVMATIPPPPKPCTMEDIKWRTDC